MPKEVTLPLESTIYLAKDGTSKVEHTKSERKMLKTYNELCASKDPLAMRMKETIDRLLVINEPEDE